MKGDAPVVPYGAAAGLFACYVMHDALQESLFRTPGFVYGLFATAVVITVGGTTLRTGVGVDQAHRNLHDPGSHVVAPKHELFTAVRAAVQGLC